MSVDYEYLGLEIVNSKISKNKERATVLFRALFKKDNAYMAVEENAIFLRFKGDIKEGFSGRTVYSKDGKNPINTAPVSAKFDTAINNKWSTTDTDATAPVVKKENEQVRYVKTFKILFFLSINLAFPSFLIIFLSIVSMLGYLQCAKQAYLIYLSFYFLICFCFSSLFCISFVPCKIYFNE